MTIQLGGPLLLVGAGKMGSAMATGWLEQGLSPADLYIQDPYVLPEVQRLVDQYGIACSASPRLPQPPEVIVLAVKPQMFEAVVPPLAAIAGPRTLFLSIAAGKSLATLARLIGRPAAIVRSMPNTPAAIGAGMTVACSNDQVAGDQIEHCITLLSAVGEIAWIKDETQMDAVTAVSGSGPAYLFALTECLARAGMQQGLDEALSWQLARTTMEGAAQLMRHSTADPITLRHNVTSPGGTTQAALGVLLGEPGLQELMNRAIEAATRRSQELSG
jgi:pyrroline-5-carboxylate reductase